MFFVHDLIVLVRFLILVSLTVAERNTNCTTPNLEAATCTGISDCQILLAAINYHRGNKTVTDFARNSQCGYDTEPLVCCGTSAYPKPQLNVLDIFTRAPPTTIPPKRIINLNTISSTALPDRSICGLERETPRLIGGTATAIDEFPWMALIRYNDNKGENAGFKCGGTLINNKFVLTAAHCVLTEPEPFEAVGVRLGEWRISTQRDCVVTVAVENCAEPVVDVLLENFVPHPYYSSRNGNNDIALLRLEKEVKYTDFIRPICLPPINLPTPEIGTIMTVCGWGAIETGSLSDIKLKIEIPLVANSKCAERISNYTYISANQICAGGVEGKDACQGDSGGPLMRTYVDDDSQWYQEGVVARGRGCGKKNFPGVYTRVSRYVGWIIKTIENANSS